MLTFKVKPLKITETEGIYPVTLEQGVQDLSGNTLDAKLSSITSDLVDNVVRTDQQELTPEQQAQARANIGVIGVTDVVMTTPQQLSEEQKQQARANIDVVGVTDVVKTIPQTLTDEEQRQARKNIGLGDGTIDTEVTEGSQNLITSDAVFQALSGISSASTAEYATSATTAEKATSAMTSAFADQAASATTAEKATSAMTSAFADQAASATTAEKATSAMTSAFADQAASATTAEKATSAMTSAFADQAASATTAEKATSAMTSAFADQAASATTAEKATSAMTSAFADQAASATTAEKATSAMTSAFADQAASATTAISAQTVPSEGIVGIIPMENIPQGAVEKLVIVADEESLLELTVDTVQNGDTVKVTSPSGIMYYVKDETLLGTMEAFEPYMAGKAASVDWVNVLGKPNEYNPTAHGSDKVAKLSGYTSGTTALPLSVEDSLNEALGKLENQIANVKEESESTKDSTYISELSGYTKSQESGPKLNLSDGDTLNEALGKLEKKVDDITEHPSGTTSYTDQIFVSGYTEVTESTPIVNDDSLNLALGKLENKIGEVQVSAETAYTIAAEPKDSTYINELSGYTKSQESGVTLDLADGDTLNEALGKLEKKIEDSATPDKQDSTFINELSAYTKSIESGETLALENGDTLNEALGKLEKKADDTLTVIYDNELVTASALNDLNTAIGEVQASAETAYAVAIEPKDSTYINELSGYTKSQASGETLDLADGDTLNEALGKLEKKIEDSATPEKQDSTFIDELSAYTKSVESGDTLTLENGDTLNEALGKLEKKADDTLTRVVKDELVTSSALNDLNTAIGDVQVSAETAYAIAVEPKDSRYIDELSGYTKSEASGETLDLADGDTLNEALGKLEKKIEDSATPDKQDSTFINELSAYTKSIESGETLALENGDTLNEALGKLEKKSDDTLSALSGLTTAVGEVQASAETAYAVAIEPKDSRYIDELSGYTKSEASGETLGLADGNTLNEALGKLEKKADDTLAVIYDNELVTASALNELNTAVGEVQVSAETAYAVAVEPKDSTYINELSGYTKSQESGPKLNLADGDPLNVALGKLEKKVDDITEHPSGTTSYTDQIFVSGYTKASESAPIANDDDLNEALGKLEKKSDDTLSTLSGLTTVVGEVQVSAETAYAIAIEPKDSRYIDELSGYTKSEASGATLDLADGDTLNEALGKLEKKIEDSATPDKQDSTFINELSAYTKSIESGETLALENGDTLNEALGKLEKKADDTLTVIYDNELVTSSALNELNAKIDTPKDSTYINELSGYTKSQASGETLDLADGDTLNEALGKLEKKIEDSATPDKQDSTFINELSAYTKSVESGETLVLENGDTLNEALGKLEKKADDTLVALNELNTEISTPKDSTYINELSGYTKSEASGATLDLADGDTLNEALGKLEKKIEDSATPDKQDSTFINELSAYTKSVESGDTLALENGDTLNEALGKLEKKADDTLTRVVKDELVTSSALNDLNTAIGEVQVSAETAYAIAVEPKDSRYIDELSGYTKSEASGATLDLADGDTLNEALGKLEKKADDALDQLSGMTNYTDSIIVSAYTKAVEEAAIEDEDNLNEALGKLEYKVDNITFIPDDIIDAIVAQSPIEDVPPSTHMEDPTQVDIDYDSEDQSVNATGDLSHVTYEGDTKTVGMFVSNASYDSENKTIIFG